MLKSKLIDKHLLKKHRLLVNIAPLLATAIFMAGCGVSSVPSEAEAKNQLKLLLKDCDSVSIRDFKKINGVPQQDGSYIVSVDYTLRATPVSENGKSWSDFIERKGSIDAEYGKFEENFKNMQLEVDSYEKKLYSASLHDNSPEHQEMEVKRAELKARNNEYLQDNQPLVQKALKLRQEENGLKNRMSTVFFNKCKIPTGTFSLSLFSKLLDKNESFAVATEKAFSSEFHLIKTDNGWVMPELWKR